jgi:hypothetical protein
MEMGAEGALDLAREQSTGRVRDWRARAMKIGRSDRVFGSGESVDATSGVLDQDAVRIVVLGIL